MPFFKRLEVWLLLAIGLAATLWVLLPEPTGDDTAIADPAAAAAPAEPALRILRCTLERDFGNARLDLELRYANPAPRPLLLAAPDVRLLAADGRMSYTDLGKATGLSTSAVHQRVRRLEQRGVIKGYTIVVDHDQLGLPLTALISIKPIDPAAPDDAPQRLEEVSAIEACHSVAGDESYVLKVRVGSPADLELLLAEIRAKANVSTRTSVVLSTPYENRPPAL